MSATVTTVERTAGPFILPATRPGLALRRENLWRHLEALNKELWLILSLFVIALLLNKVLAPRMLLNVYALPTIVSAYVYGRRHATLTARASVLMVVLLIHLNVVSFTALGAAAVAGQAAIGSDQWIEVTVWGSTLLIAAYLMGTLYDHKTEQLGELRETYHGVLMILRHFISNDRYTENHSYRVSIYATRIAGHLNLDPERIEDVRAAALLHDIGKLDLSRDLLYKAARLTAEEFAEIRTHTNKGVSLLEPVGGSLRRILPIVLTHHEKFDGSGDQALRGEEIPLEARIITVADVYDALTSDRPYRKAMSPFDAKGIIERGARTDFDPVVVEAFQVVFRQGALEIPAVVV